MSCVDYAIKPSVLQMQPVTGSYFKNIKTITIHVYLSPLDTITFTKTLHIFTLNWNINKGLCCCVLCLWLKYIYHKSCIDFMMHSWAPVWCFCSTFHASGCVICPVDPNTFSISVLSWSRSRQSWLHHYLLNWASYWQVGAVGS